MKRATKRGLKKIKGLLLAWRLLIIIIMATALVPLFLKARNNTTFYTLTVMASILAYLLIVIIQQRLKKGLIKGFLESLSARLLPALVVLAIAGMTRGTAQQTLLVAAAVLYASVLQKVSFFRVIA